MFGHMAQIQLLLLGTQTCSAPAHTQILNYSVHVTHFHRFRHILLVMHGEKLQNLLGVRDKNTDTKLIFSSGLAPTSKILTRMS